MTVELPEKFEAIVVNATQEWLDTRGTTRDELRKFIEGRVIEIRNTRRKSAKMPLISTLNDWITRVTALARWNAFLIILARLLD